MQGLRSKYGREDHLHIRGEYKDIKLKDGDIEGSSPHTWRIQSAIYGKTYAYRIISTYVENTFYLGKEGDEIWDHLHIRGEYTKRIL